LELFKRFVEISGAQQSLKAKKKVEHENAGLI